MRQRNVTSNYNYVNSVGLQYIHIQTGIIINMFGIPNLGILSIFACHVHNLYRAVVLSTSSCVTTLLLLLEPDPVLGTFAEAARLRDFQSSTSPVAK